MTPPVELITNLCRVYSAEDISVLADWCEENGLLGWAKMLACSDLYEYKAVIVVQMVVSFGMTELGKPEYDLLFMPSREAKYLLMKWGK